MTATPIFIEEWSLEKVLGSGGFGIVELWAHTSGKKVAIKKCKWDITQLTQTQQKRWINELLTMKRLKHKNIIKALELPFRHPDERIELPILCMEFCRKGDLRKILNEVENCCGISEKDAVCVMKDISSAVEYLHSNNITHRDLKPENIVLQDDHNIISYKLIDLGYAKELGEASIFASIVGTLNYVAPELLWKESYSCSVDYWSLGILFYELVTGTRPFLPKMQHTATWMQHIKNKGYNDICAFKSGDKIIFGQDIMGPTNLSKCLRNKLVEWFRVVLQWDPKKRGKQCDENNVMQLVVFKLLRFILSKQIIHVFSVSTYKINAYEVGDTTSIADLQCMIEKDTNIPINQQILTDYFGKVLAANEISLLSQIQYPVLFIFENSSALMDNIPVPNIPTTVQKMIELSRAQLDFETLMDYYRVAIFFMKQEIHLFQLYIFALTIKVDLIITRFNAFSENITNASANIKALLNELFIIQAKFEKECLNVEKKMALDITFKKVTKLVEATNEITLKFNPLIQESNELKNTAQCIDCVKYLSELYKKAVELFELHKNEHFRKSAKPTEMVKIIFKFLQVQGEQFHNENIREIIKQITKLEVKLLTLESIFDSVIAVTTVYSKELQSIVRSTSDHVPPVLKEEQHFNTSTPLRNETAKVSTNSDIKRMSTTYNSNQSSNTSIAGHDETADGESDVIYDNLVIRYILDNFLREVQKKYMELVSLEP